MTRFSGSTSRGVNVLLAIFTAVVLAIFLGACGDEPANLDGTGNGNGNGNGNGTGTGTDGPHLELVSTADPIISFSEQIDVQVKYVNGNGNAVPSTLLAFEVVGDRQDTNLSAMNASTGGDGIASVQVTAGVQIVDFSISVSVMDNDAVTPLTVRIRVQPKDTSDYVLRITYGGPIRLQEVRVSLYTTDTECDDLVQSSTEAPSNDSAMQSITVLPDAEGNFHDQPFVAPETATFTYAVARGEPRGDTPEQGRGYFVTFGCNDALPANEAGTATVIEVEMSNLWPETEGTYRLRSDINLIDAIPDDAQETVDAIIGIFEHPGLGILKLIAIAYYEITGPEYEDCGGDDCRALEYWETSPWSYVLDEDADGNIVADGAGIALIGVLDTLVQTALDNAGTFGGTITGIVDAINDLMDNAQNFTMVGDLVITANPDANGSIGAANEVRFNQIDLSWNESDYSFYMRDGALIQAEDVEASVTFNPDDDQGYALEIEPFGLEVHYGDLIIWLVENVVFSRFLEDDDGQPITSFDGFFDSIIDCEAVGVEVENAVGFGADMVEVACDQFADVAVDALESWVRGLTADIGNYVRLATPDGDPCAIGFSDTVVEFKATAFGAVGEECVWDGEVQHSTEASSSEELEGIFWTE